MKRARDETQTTLVYAGAFTDASFLFQSWSQQYTRFILMDALPANEYFKNCPTNKLCCDLDTFIASLEVSFGQLLKHDQLLSTLYFPNNIEYRYNYDAELFQEPGDIFVSGYCAKTFKTKEFLMGRRVWRACTTSNRLGFQEETVVHQQRCRCI
jgi:hypothetical protein